LIDYAAITLVKSLIKSGTSLGPALAFMAAEAATSIPTAIVGFALAKRPSFMWNFLLATVGSLVVKQTFRFCMQFSY
jgi:uncharacterized membrane protein YraQ (UPF0718 family)